MWLVCVHAGVHPPGVQAHKQPHRGTAARGAAPPCGHLVGWLCPWGTSTGKAVEGEPPQGAPRPLPPGLKPCSWGGRPPAVWGLPDRPPQEGWQPQSPHPRGNGSQGEEAGEVEIRVWCLGHVAAAPWPCAPEKPAGSQELKGPAPSVTSNGSCACGRKRFADCKFTSWHLLQVTHGSTFSPTLGVGPGRQCSAMLWSWGPGAVGGQTGCGLGAPAGRHPPCSLGVLRLPAGRRGAIWGRGRCTGVLHLENILHAWSTGFGSPGLTL